MPVVSQGLPGVNEPLNKLLREMPLLGKVYAFLPSMQQPQRVVDIFLSIDEIVNTTAAKHVRAPAAQPDWGRNWIGGGVFDEGSVGLPVGTTDDRWMLWAAHLSRSLPRHNQHWSWLCGQRLQWRRPTQAHWDAFHALKGELTLLWDVAREQDYASTIAARVDARRRTIAAIQTLAEASKCRLSASERRALSCNPQALQQALQEGIGRLTELKKHEEMLSPGSEMHPRLLQIRNGLLELQAAYLKALSDAAAVSAARCRAARKLGGANRFTSVSLRSAIRRTRSGQRMG